MEESTAAEIRLPTGCGKQTVERVVSKSSVELVGAEDCVWDSATRCAVLHQQNVACEVVDVTDVLKHGVGWSVSIAVRLCIFFGAQSSQAKCFVLVGIASQAIVSICDKRSLSLCVVADPFDVNCAIELDALERAGTVVSRL